MCSPETTRICDALQTIRIEAECDPAFDAWVYEVSKYLPHPVAITYPLPGISLRELYEGSIAPATVAHLLARHYRVLTTIAWPIAAELVPA